MNRNTQILMIGFSWLISSLIQLKQVFQIMELKAYGISIGEPLMNAMFMLFAIFLLHLGILFHLVEEE